MADQEIDHQATVHGVKEIAQTNHGNHVSGAQLPRHVSPYYSILDRIRIQAKALRVAKCTLPTLPPGVL